MNQEQRIRDGVLFWTDDAALCEKKLRSHTMSRTFSDIPESDVAGRTAHLRQFLGAFGDGGYLVGPIFFHYGCHTQIGENFYANYNFTVQDDGAVTIGDNCSFGPNVTIVTPVHPMLPEERRQLRGPDGVLRPMCWAKPVVIGNDCWFGANVVVCPGVTIGDNCVIGAGSVVTKDIPANSIAVGNPCRVLRTLSDADSMKHRPELFGDEEFVFD